MAGNRFSFFTYSDDNRGCVIRSGDQKDKMEDGSGVVQGNIQFDSPIHGVGVVPVGSVIPWAGVNNENQGWLHCDGRSLNKNDYPQLFNAIEYTYGGEGDNFNLPDLRGRVVAGLSNNNDVLTGAMNLGQKKGSQTHKLTTNEIPSHTHGIGGLSRQLNTAGNADYRLSPGNSAVGSTKSSGGGGLHNNVQPTIVLNYLIRVQ